MLNAFLSLNLSQHTRWTAAQEGSLSSYPLTPPLTTTESEEDQASQYVVRTYLQFLWLPDSIMPLSLLIPSMVCVNTSLTSTSPHPLHMLLEPLLMTPRAAAKKYHSELLQILMEGGGAGEIEETMMWFALTHEKGASDTESKDGDNSPWKDARWRESWLERMERREVQVQILLHFLKLSLPGQQGEPDIPLARPWLRSRRRSQRKVPTLSIKGALEAYMDKLSAWQLLLAMDSSILGTDRASSSDKDNRDWIQAFVQDVVEKQFRSYLPDLCHVLHDKVFTSSPFSDRGTEFFESQPSPRSATPISDSESNTRSITTAAPVAGRQISPSAQVGLVSNLAKCKRQSSAHLSRSRSLSVTLQQERESQRGISNKQKKHPLNREVSMTRVFRARSKGAEAVFANTPDSHNPNAGAIFRKKTRSTKQTSRGQGYPNATVTRNEAITLVEATPVKSRILTTSNASGILGYSQTSDEEIWELSESTPTLLNLEFSESAETAESKVASRERGVVLVAETPKKAMKVRV